MLNRFAPNDIVPLRQLFIKYDSLSCKHILQTAMVLHSRILLYVQTDYVLLEKDTMSWSRATESLSCTFNVAEHFLFLGINTENWYSKACTRCPGSFQKFEQSVSVLDFLQGLCLAKGTFLEASVFNTLRAI